MIDYTDIINNDLTATVGTKAVDFEFIYDSTSGKYGYKDGADTFRPFNDAPDYSGITYTNLLAANIKSGVTITVKDPNGNTLKTVTGTYAGDTKHSVYAAADAINHDERTVYLYVDGTLKTSRKGSAYATTSTSTIQV